VIGIIITGLAENKYMTILLESNSKNIEQKLLNKALVFF
jgi:hypothetical protein